MCTMQPRFEAFWKVLAMESYIAQLDGDERGASDLECTVQEFVSRLEFRTRAAGEPVEPHVWNEVFERLHSAGWDQPTLSGAGRERREHDGVLCWLSAWHLFSEPHADIEALLYSSRRAALDAVLANSSAAASGFLARHSGAVLKFLRKYRFATNDIESFDTIALETCLLLLTLKYRPEIVLELRHERLITMAKTLSSDAGRGALASVFESLSKLCRDVWTRHNAAIDDSMVDTLLEHPVLAELVLSETSDSLAPLAFGQLYLNHHQRSHGRYMTVPEEIIDSGLLGHELVEPLRLLAQSSIETHVVVELREQGTVLVTESREREAGARPERTSLLRSHATEETKPLEPGDIVWVRRVGLRAHFHNDPMAAIGHDLILPGQLSVVRAGHVPEAPAPSGGAGLRLEPLLTVEDLLREGYQQGHCLGALMSQRLALESKTSLFFRVLWPERASLELQRRSTGWVVAELWLRYNEPPKPHTRSVVEHWLDGCLRDEAVDHLQDRSQKSGPVESHSNAQRAGSQPPGSGWVKRRCEAIAGVQVRRATRPAAVVCSEPQELFPRRHNGLLITVRRIIGALSFVGRLLRAFCLNSIR
jgi:hypothetical protein